MSTLPDPDKGFTVTNFPEPFTVTAFPDSPDFHPTAALAIGVEVCNTYHGKRLIVRPTAPVIRKSTGKQEQWPNGVLYLWERNVSGWKANA